MARRELWEQVDADLYLVLGVSEDASDDEIQLAWRAAAKRLHPDRGGNIEEFQRAEIAYQVLSSPLERSRYDRTRVKQTRYAYAGGPSAPRASATTSTPRYYWVNPDFGTYRTAQATDMRGATNKTQRRRMNPWMVALAVLVGIVAVIVAVVLSLVTFVFLFGLAILAVGRFLNPNRSNPDRSPKV